MPYIHSRLFYNLSTIVNNSLYVLIFTWFCFSMLSDTVTFYIYLFSIFESFLKCRYFVLIIYCCVLCLRLPILLHAIKWFYILLLFRLWLCNATDIVSLCPALNVSFIDFLCDFVCIVCHYCNMVCDELKVSFLGAYIHLLKYHYKRIILCISHIFWKTCYHNWCYV